MSHKRGVVLLFPLAILAVFLAVVTGGYFFWQKQQIVNNIAPVSRINPTPAQDNTANWNTYTDQGYGFTFKYPPGWEVTKDFGQGLSEIVKGSPVYIVDVSIQRKNVDYGWSQIDINPEETPDIARVVDPESEMSTELVGGTPVKVYSSKNSAGQNVKIYGNFTSTKLPDLSITVIYNDRDNSVVSRILSTFQFLDQK